MKTNSHKKKKKSSRSFSKSSAANNSLHVQSLNAHTAWEFCGLDLIRAGMWTCLHSSDVKGQELGKGPPLLLIYATHKASTRKNRQPWSESSAFHRQPWVHEERSQSIIYPHSAPLCLGSDNTSCPLFNYTAVRLHFFQYASQLNYYRVQL